MSIGANSPQKSYTLGQMRTKVLVSAVMVGQFFLVFALIALLGSDSGNTRLFVVPSAAVLIAGIFMFVGYRRSVKKEGAPKVSKATMAAAIAIFAGSVVCMFLAMIIPTTMRLVRSSQLGNALEKYVKDDWSSTDVEVPEHPKYVLYDMDSKSFLYPKDSFLGKEYLSKSAYIADSPEEVTVVIGYKDGGTGKNGTWNDKNTGKVIEDARVQRATVYAIRLEDWALIDQSEISQQLKQNENGVNVQGMLNGFDIDYLLEHGHFEN